MRPEPCNSWCIYEKGICRFCGWPKDRSTMGLRYWDVERAEFREPTQQDIDELCAVRTAYARILARFHEDRAMLIEEVKGIRSRAGMPNDLMVDRRPASIEDGEG